MMMFTIIIIPMVVTLSFLLLLQRAVSVGDDGKMKIIVIMMNDGDGEHDEDELDEVKMMM